MCSRLVKYHSEPCMYFCLKVELKCKGIILCYVFYADVVSSSISIVSPEEFNNFPGRKVISAPTSLSFLVL